MDSTYKKIYEHVIGILTKQLPDHLTYHSLLHTLYVLEKVIYIATKENVSKEDLRLLKIAALYHDIGFIKTPTEHESIGCEIAREDLRGQKFSENDIDTICGMIMATRIPQQPKTHLEAILADADLEYLGTKHFEKISELLYKELRHYNNKLTKKEWNSIQHQFMTKHQYHTKFCIRHKAHRKRKNMQQLN